jgi:hypothetical protein
MQEKTIKTTLQNLCHTRQSLDGLPSNYTFEAEELKYLAFISMQYHHQHPNILKVMAKLP